MPPPLQRANNRWRGPRTLRLARSCWREKWEQNSHPLKVRQFRLQSDKPKLIGNYARAPQSSRFFYSQVLKSDAVTSGTIFSLCGIKCFSFCGCSLCGSCGLAFSLLLFLWFVESFRIAKFVCVVSVCLRRSTLPGRSGRRLAGLSVDPPLSFLVCLFFSLFFLSGKTEEASAESRVVFQEVLAGPPAASRSLPRLCFNTSRREKKMILQNQPCRNLYKKKRWCSQQKKRKSEQCL